MTITLVRNVNDPSTFDLITKDSKHKTYVWANMHEDFIHLNFPNFDFGDFQSVEEVELNVQICNFITDLTY
jgi:hypothetical protein